MSGSTHAYLSLPDPEAPQGETRLRACLAEYARVEGLELRSVFVDRRGEQPCGFVTMRELLRRGDVRAVLLPDLTHVAHIPAVALLSRAGLARWLGAAVLLAVPSPARWVLG